MTIESRQGGFVFVNPERLVSLRLVGSLEQAIQLRRATEGVATLRAHRASRWTGSVPYRLELSVPATIWSSVSQPRSSWEAIVPAGRYQAMLLYASPRTDRVVCEALSPPVDLPELMILTTQ